ncbi:MAG: hypothetical protein V3R67_06080 [Thermodesulfobacteriota bacterium]|nr:hypothetical protein [Candidatus Dadabacteria bacterium]
MNSTVTLSPTIASSVTSTTTNEVSSLSLVTIFTASPGFMID